IKELEKFIKDIFQKNDFTFGRDRSEQYLNEYLKEESVKSYGGQLYNLKLIKNEAIKSSEFLLKKEYSEKETKSAEKIQKIFKLKSLYKKFVNNPSKTYKTFSNDKLANEMFGKHIATISTSDNQIKVPDYITTDQYLDYHRSAYSAKQQTFHTTNLRILSDPSKITTLGVTLSNWQGAIERTKNDRMQNTQTKDAEDILKQYAKTSQQILSSEELKKLKAISFYKFNFSLHAQEVHEMIIKVCNHIENNGLNNIQNENSNRIRDNIARLHMFLTMLVTLHNNNHIKFTAMLEPVIHELSILVYEITNINSTPFITHQEFNQAIKKEFLEENGTAKINKKYENISASGYTANSGMHAYTVGLYISKIILNNNDENKTLYSFKEYGKDHYYETENIANSLGIPKNDNSPNIHIVNGSVMNGFTPYTRGVDINKFIGNLLEEGMFRNNKHNIIVLDNTNANYDNLKLDDETQILIDKGLLTIVVWESWQKMGILGTDQAQYGRVVVLSSKSILEKKLDSINQEAEKDIIKLDMQIGALFQICRKQHNKYRELNFKNGETLRSKIGVNSSEMHQIGPFLVNNDIKKVLKVYKPAFIRNSFGFNFISIVGSRISAGTEANIDIKIFSSVLKKLIKNTADNQEKIICLNNLIYELNNYFSTLKINSLSDSKLEIIELMSYLSLVQMVIQYPRYYNLKNKLNNDNIIKICDQFLKEHNKKHYNELIYKYLEGSKKSLSIIANLKLKLRKDN
ncbi:MAG TPA: hypothetical protein PKD00_05535, partial [Burkholderiales bacterium]|nr:hypothetical protein [Burkholderiales bacterium]